MDDILELGGPKVLATREGTADSGGGQLRVADGKVVVQAKLIARELGAVSALDQVAFADKRTAHLHFQGGARWEVVDRDEGQLLAFAQELSERIHRPDLVRSPPSVSQRFRRAWTPGIRRHAAFVALGLALLWPARALCGALPGLGYVLLALVLLWFLLLAVGDRFALPAGWRRWLERAAWSSHIVLPVSLALGVGLGVLDANETARQREQAERAAQLAAEKQAKAQRAAEQAALATRAEADALAKRVDALIEKRAFREAAVLTDAIAKKVPDHPSLAGARKALAPALAQLDEEQRQHDLAKGLRLAKRTTRDRVACESAGEVSEAWRLLQHARPQDERFNAASKLASALERCRQRLHRAFVDNASQTQRSQRALAARQLEDRLKRQGQGARVSLEGKRRDVVKVILATLDRDSAGRVLDSEEGGRAALLARWERMGAGRVVIAGKRGQPVVMELKPPSLDAFATQMLERFGLDHPLVLAAAD